MKNLVFIVLRGRKKSSFTSGLKIGQNTTSQTEILIDPEAHIKYAKTTLGRFQLISDIGNVIFMPPGINCCGGKVTNLSALSPNKLLFTDELSEKKIFL